MVSATLIEHNWGRTR